MSTRFPDSFHGFVDYSACFPEPDVIWLIVGCGIFIGTWGSIIPQYYLIVHNRSNFGIDSVAFCAMVFGQFILVANIICLRTADFVGWLQYPFGHVISRSLTFVNAAANWLSYLPCSFMAMIFFDQIARDLRSEDQICREWVLSRVVTVVGPLACLIATTIYVAFGVAFGFESTAIVYLGKVYGSIAAVLWAGQYLPQIWTTCRLRSPGNLSIALLAIQAPGSMVNAMFMAIGQSDDWTTWLSSFLLSIEQFIVLGLCIFFKYCKRKKRELISPPLIEKSQSSSYE
jgi:uncharacterized protein with PQ loop repeat